MLEITLFPQNNAGANAVLGLGQSLTVDTTDPWSYQGGQEYLDPYFLFVEPSLEAADAQADATRETKKTL